MEPSENFYLPPLRDDLDLLDGPPTARGEPTWTIFDPVRNQYFRLGYTAFELLNRWQLGDAASLLQAVHAETTVSAQPEDLKALVQFLLQHNLLRGDTPAAVDNYRSQHDASRQTIWQWLLHHYLFFRIPLLHPDRFLGRMLRYVRPLYTRTTLYIVLGAGALGILMAAQQWESFAHTFRHFFSSEGILYYAIAIGSVKIMHELGHAFTVKRYGGRVPTMGLGFLVMMPVLYTDATDTWRLASRRQRAAIAGAGMIVELSVALLATLAWSFLSDGPARSAAFFLATVSWVMTLLINLSPFTRFDGYFVLSDWLGVDNLQTRSFALARWRLREWLFKLNAPPPERFPASTHRLLLVYAYAAWTYRFVLFTGIAFMVYHLFFKVLGLVLLGVELSWFVALPIVRELREWWRRRHSVRANRHSLLTLTAAISVVLILVVPWQRHIELPAIERAARFAVLYPDSAARIDKVFVRQGARVKAGELLYRLSSPTLEDGLQRTASEIQLLELKLRRRASSAQDLENQQALEQQLSGQLAKQRGLLDQENHLAIHAPFAGRLVDVPIGLSAGRWVSTHQSLGRLIAPGQAQLIAYVGEPNLSRIHSGAHARFYPGDPAIAPIDATVKSVDTVNLKRLNLPYVASVYHGDIAVTRGPKHHLTPVDTIYRVTLTPHVKKLRLTRVVRGHVRVAVAANSLIGRLWRHIAAVVIRESGF